MKVSEEMFLYFSQVLDVYIQDVHVSIIPINNEFNLSIDSNSVCPRFNDC